MKKDPLPAEFVAYVRSLYLSDQRRDIRRIHRWLILRWGFWLDGVSDNALPGYATCPKPAFGSEFPAGWSYQKFHAIAREATGTDAIHRARRTASLQTRSYPYRDCGSGQHYGICTVCGKGHGHILYQDGKPSTLVTATH